MAIKYKWLADRLKELIRFHIENGIDRLPTEEALCERYQMSRQTVRQALLLLEEEGLILRVKGSGTYITGLLDDPEANHIAILLSNTQDYLYPGLAHDIRTELSAAGFTSSIFVTGDSTYKEREILSAILRDGNWRGLIVEGCRSALPNPNLDLYRELLVRHTNILFLHNRYAGLDCPCIKDDNSGGSELLVKHLLDKGHTSIAGIFMADSLQGHERYQGFMETMRSRNLPVPDHHVAWFHSEDLSKLRSKHDTRFLTAIIQDTLSDCSAVICYNDEIAYWLATELPLAGFQLPMDMAITSFDNTYLSDSNRLPITGLSHVPHIVGQTIARECTRQNKGLPVESQTIPWDLLIKRSSSL